MKKFFLLMAFLFIGLPTFAQQIDLSTQVQGQLPAANALFAATKTSVQVQGYTAANDTGAANAYVVALTPALSGSYQPYQVVVFIAANSNSGASTLNAGLGAVALTKCPNFQALVLGDINAGDIVTAVYDGTRFQTVGLCGSATGANVFLSNLSSPVAINQSLLPGAAGGVNLGSNPLPWGNLFLGLVANQSLSFNLAALSANHTVTVPNANTILPQPYAALSHQFLISLDSAVGAFSSQQPALSDIAGGASPAGNYNFSGAVQLELPVSVGCTTSVNGQVCLDSTNKNYHSFANGVDNYVVLVPTSTSLTNLDCANWSVVSGVIRLGDAGAACGSGAGTGANTSLSNLVATSINQSLLPGAAPVNLGNTTSPWGDVFIGTGGKALDINTSALTTNQTITAVDAPTILVQPAAAITHFFVTGLSNANGQLLVAQPSLADIAPGASSSGNFNFSLATALEVPVSAGCTTTVSGQICYDSTSNNYHIFGNGVDNINLVTPTASSVTNADCAQYSVVSNVITIVDSGAPCAISGTVLAAPQYSMPYYSLAGTHTTLNAHPTFTTNANNSLIQALGIITTDINPLNISWAYNASGVTFNGHKEVITNTASAGGSLGWQWCVSVSCAAIDVSATPDLTVPGYIVAGGTTNNCGTSVGCAALLEDASAATGVAGVDIIHARQSNHWLNILNNNGTEEPIAGLHGTITTGDMASFFSATEINDSGIIAANVVNNSVLGSANQIPKFTAAHVIAPGLATDSGTVFTIPEILDMTANPVASEVANSGSGTSLNRLAKLTGAPSTAITAVISDTSGILGVVVGGAGTSGNAQIAVLGIASCIFDGATTAGDYVTISGSVAGDCKDVASPGSTQTIGRVLTTNASAGTYTVFLTIGAGSGTGGTPCTTTALSFQFNNGGVFGCVADLTYNTHTITLGASGLVNLSAAASGGFIVPVAAGATSAANGSIDYDSTNNNTHIRTNAADSIAVAEASAITGGFFPEATDSTHGLIKISPCDDGITTANVFTCTESSGAQFSGPVRAGTAPSLTSGTAFVIWGSEGTGPSAIGAGGAYLYPDSTSHEWQGASNASTSPAMFVRVRPGAIHSTANTGAIATATLCAASAGACNQAGQYTVHWDFIETGTACATPGTGGVTFLLTWTDTNGTAHSAVSIPMNDASSLTATSGTFHFQTALASAWASGNFNISTNGTIIQYATGYTACGTGTGSYQLDASVTRQE